MSFDSYAPLSPSSRVIRLIALGPGTLKDALHCTVQEVPLNSALGYTAISHAWKHDDAKVPIVCDGRIRLVDYSLYLALRRLRHRQAVVMVWVDALCIHLDDPKDRTEQTGMMREIFINCSELTIWLGDRGGNDDFGERHIKQISNDADPPQHWIVWHDDHRDEAKVHAYLQEFYDFERMLENPPARPKTRYHWTDVFGAFCLLHLLSMGTRCADIAFFRNVTWASRAIEGLRGIMELPWWNRIWVVEETVLAPKATVFYSKMEAPWSMFAKAAKNYTQDRFSGDFDLTATQFTRQALTLLTRGVLEIESTRASWDNKIPMTLLPLLRKYRSRQATDKRDKVFSLLALTSHWEYGNRILADYDMTFEQTMWKATTKLIKSMRSLSVLLGTVQGDTADAPKTELPSWVMDWSISPPMPEQDRLGRMEMFDASAGQSGLVRVHGSRMLEVRGFMVDEVVICGSALPDARAIQQRQIIEEWARIAKSRIGDQYAPGWVWAEPKTLVGTGENAFWRTLCADMLYVGNEVDDRHTQRFGPYKRADLTGSEQYRSWRAAGLDPRSTGSMLSLMDEQKWQSYPDPQPQKLTKSKDKFHHAIQAACTSRRFFITRKGYMGIGPSQTTVGHEIAVFLCSNVPFMLEKSGPLRCREKELRELVPDPSGTRLPPFCSDKHFPYRLVGDAYVHGLMDGQAVRIAMANSQPAAPICLI